MSAAAGLLSHNFAKVEARIARASYGIRVRRYWVDGEFKEEDKVWVPREGIYRADNQMDWYLKKVSPRSNKLELLSTCVLVIRHDYTYLADILTIHLPIG
jgi:hypothetical protein